jgi:flagellar biosynthesis/type III secretory pathway chaperone
MTTWQDLADSLRAEAAEYGQLLALFEEQQRLLFRRQPETVLQLAHAIQRQSGAVVGSRRRREQAVAAFAGLNGQRADATIRSLLPFFPAESRPLMEALITEINHLIRRVRRSARLNHRLLGSLVECHQEVLRRLRPDVFTSTYSRTGRVSLAMRPAASMQTAG